MEHEPNTENVVYMDEYRKARWISELNRARDMGQIALFNQDYEHPGQLLLFPTPGEGEPDGAA